MRLALALSLSLAPAPAVAAPSPPSERDLAYERAVQAEEAGDYAAAAVHYERAFQLTPPAESGPRLLFLRSSVSARQRAFDGSSDARAHLCPARASLRDYLDTATKPDATLAERDNLRKLEAQLAASRIDCTAPDAPAPDAPASDAPPPDPRPEPEPPPPSPATTTRTPPRPIGPEPAPASRQPPVTRNLQITGGAVLGVGLAGLALMTAGIVLAADARRDGAESCFTQPEACDGSTTEIRDIRKHGRIANGLIPAGATIGGIGLVTGIVLLAVSKRAGRPRVALTPSPTSLTLSGRF